VRIPTLAPKFVDNISGDLVSGVLYVCIRYATVVHLCCCGCDNEVITPLTPTDWSLTFAGETVSLSPSVGNWSFDCRSHHWIRHNRVEWAPAWSVAKVEYARAWVREERADYSRQHEIPAAETGATRAKHLLR
jgi:Family of unknown function (DUF6527)